MNVQKIIKEEISKSYRINEGESPQTETIKIGDKELEVTFTYTPEEAEVRYYRDGSGHPGTPSQIDIESVIFKGREVINLLPQNVFEKIEEILYDRMENNNSDDYLDDEYDNAY